MHYKQNTTCFMPTIRFKPFFIRINLARDRSGVYFVLRVTVLQSIIMILMNFTSLAVEKQNTTHLRKSLIIGDSVNKEIIL